jgi:predicted ATPase/signal transduction histidine kinase/ActR/RegA family two-component response regulator
MTDLAGYVFSPLCDGDTTLYRGSGVGLAPVLLVTVDDSSPGCLKRLEHEYALRGQLDAAWAARPLSLSRFGDRYALVLDDPGGVPLDRLLIEPLELAVFLRIAISLAGTLRQVHARGLIHKDIKPGNVLVNMDTRATWLTGFGIAARQPRERQDREPPEFLAGTLAYMAPEQTGRMNQSVDFRSDLYSLGVTFYQMLTGTLPFAAADPMEWVHCHIARQPTPLSEYATVPEPISALVTKLLAKPPCDRYQSAAGIEGDLRRCLAEWDSHGHIDMFALGAHDTSGRLAIPERVYGRECEVATLVAAFERVTADGTPELVLVSGCSGIGKSSVVHELRRALVPLGGLFASGKPDQYKRDSPYVAFAHAVQSLIRPLLSQSEDELSRWRRALIDALGPNRQLIVNLVPDLKLVIGASPPVPELPPREAKGRHHEVFRRFLGTFACEEHPLVLFLDDSQWLDSATLDLIEYLMTHPKVRHLLLVGAYRDNEVAAKSSLLRTLAAIRTTDVRVHEIALAPLQIDDVGQFVADALHCELKRARPLVQLLQKKTGGNPFFAIQFLTALAEDNLLIFDPAAPAWTWDIDRIRARNCTDNVADLVARKLKRLSATTQRALQQLACLGNIVDVATLTLVREETEETTHAALWGAVLAGLVRREDSAYKFVHDRVQQAAYSTIPEAYRTEIHLCIGRALMGKMATAQLAENLFDVANQLNRGAAFVIVNEKAQVASINLRAGRKAKASAAYSSACVYLAAGMAMLDDSYWASHYELTFSLWLERASCEFLTGNLDKTEHLITELLARSASNIDQAGAYRLKVQLHVMKSDSPQAVTSGLACLNLFGIDLPARPTWEQVQAEYKTICEVLDGRPIESLIDLPLMTDPELQAAIGMLSALDHPAYCTDFHLYCLVLCRMVNMSLRHGVWGPSAHGYGYFGFLLGPVFRRYSEGYRFARLACDVVEKYGFIADQAKTYFSMGLVAVWTQPIATAIEFLRTAFRTATETGDLAFACVSKAAIVANLLLRNDPLDAVWSESEHSLDFVRKARFNDVADLIVGYQRFIAAMQGRTTTLSSFSDKQFDEAGFEEKLAAGRTGPMLCSYWILKMKAQFLSGNYRAALAASEKTNALLGYTVNITLLDYYYYTALTVGALFENASVDEQIKWCVFLKKCQDELGEWAGSYPPTFGCKHALVSAEIARLEGRDLDAMRLYEQAIRSAREHGFMESEGLSHEIAAQFYAARSFDTIAHAYLHNARCCYLRWGALGKVHQLDRRHPWLCKTSAPVAPKATMGTPFEHLDLATVVKASQAVSGEIEHRKLIETLLRIAIEHAAAERGLLILFRGDGPRIEAEATTGRGSVQVTLRQATVTPSDLPESVLQYMIRTRESVILDDAAGPTFFSADPYLLQGLARSVLCLPLVKQTKLVGALYIENNLTPCAFTSSRTAVLELLASQAAISLENARLYSELRYNEAFLAQGQSISSTGSFRWNVRSGETYWSTETFRIFEYDRAVKPTEKLVQQRVHPDDLPFVQETTARLSKARTNFDIEFRLVMADGRVKNVHVIGRATHNTDGFEYVGAVMDITEQKLGQAERARLEQRLHQAEKMEAIGRLAGGIAHDFNSVLAGVFAYGEMLFDEAPVGSPLKRYAQNVLIAASRGRELVEQILAYSRSKRCKRTPVDVTPVVAETLELIQGSLPAKIRLEVNAPDLPLVVMGVATQLHQIVMNLCSNAIQSICGYGTVRVTLEAVDFLGEQTVSHGTLKPGSYVRLVVADSGCGMDGSTLPRIFEPFFTTKEIGQGTGLGLSLVYAIITDSGGAIDVKSVPRQGSTFTTYLKRSEEIPAAVDVAEPAVAALPRGHGEHVLLISDESAVLAETSEVLSRLGYEPAAFSDTHVALATLEKAPERFRVVVADQVMAGLAGAALARVIRRHRPDLPIVLVSNSSGTSLTRDASNAGVSEILTKPLQPRALATTLARILRREITLPATTNSHDR